MLACPLKGIKGSCIHFGDPQLIGYKQKEACGLWAHARGTGHDSVQKAHTVTQTPTAIFTALELAELQKRLRNIFER